MGEAGESISAGDRGGWVRQVSPSLLTVGVGETGEFISADNRGV